MPVRDFFRVRGPGPRQHPARGSADQALNPADAATASPTDYQTAKTRLDEARVAEDKNRKEESLRRSEEASIHAEIVQEKIKLHGLGRTVSEIETGIATLRREINSQKEFDMKTCQSAAATAALSLALGGCMIGARSEPKTARCRSHAATGPRQPRHLRVRTRPA